MKKKINPTERKEIFEVLYMDIDAEELFSGSLQEVSNKVLSIEKRLRLENTFVWENPDRYIRFDISLIVDENNYLDVVVKGVRLENDTEYNMRMEDTKKKEIAKEKAKEKAKKKKILSQIEKAKRKEKEDYETFQKIKKQYGW